MCARAAWRRDLKKLLEHYIPQYSVICAFEFEIEYLECLPETCEGVWFRLTFGAVPPTVRGRLVEESTISVIETRHAVSGKRLDGCQRSPRLSLCQAFCLREISLRTAVPTLKLAMRKQAVNDTLAALRQRQKERERRSIEKRKRES